ncbi:YajQ family cyclic di-GMP-binding protein [Vulgatibacter sp.]|uniref:YajQ family cyclic di-GMP-binding protein n=1 Tax=Vulgatibacter sp. TaxID=1971226 RepID=UPI00356AA7E4
MPSFDIVSEVDLQEVDNAVNQTRKELGGRFDFRGVPVEVKLSDDKKSLQMKSDGEERLDAVWDVLLGKLLKRGMTANSLERQKKEPVGGKQYKQDVKLQQGIPTEKAKEIVKLLKDSKIKVQPSIQGETVRVTGKDKDDLQSAIRLVRENAESMKIDLQFTNFRD